MGRGRGALEDQGHRRCASAREPASVMRKRMTSIQRPPATVRSVCAVASRALIRSTRNLVLKPCASMIASVQPSRLPASNSSARRRCCLRVGIWGSDASYDGSRRDCSLFDAVTVPMGGTARNPTGKRPLRWCRS